MNKISNFVIFFVGVSIGSSATWCYVKRKYDQIAQEEIDSVKKAFSERKPIINDIRTKAECAKEKPAITNYTEVIHKQNYTTFSNDNEGTKFMTKPYVIPPEEFGEIEEYDQIGLTYYVDNVLAGDDDELIEDVDNIVGIEFSNHFGEYEDDSVFVRNDKMKCYYEILLDQRKYSDVINENPYQIKE